MPLWSSCWRYRGYAGAEWMLLIASHVSFPNQTMKGIKISEATEFWTRFWCHIYALALVSSIFQLCMMQLLIPCFLQCTKVGVKNSSASSAVEHFVWTAVKTRRKPFYQQLLISWSIKLIQLWTQWICFGYFYGLTFKWLPNYITNQTQCVDVNWWTLTWSKWLVASHRGPFLDMVIESSSIFCSFLLMMVGVYSKSAKANFTSPTGFIWANVL